MLSNRMKKQLFVYLLNLALFLMFVKILIDFNSKRNLTTRILIEKENFNICQPNFAESKNFKTRLEKVGKPFGQIINEIKAKSFSLNLGGGWSPSLCESRFKTALIIPYRNRPKQLKCFLSFFHEYLREQNVEFGIYLIEPEDGKLAFNRGALMNIGFKEALRDNPKWTCFIFHDVDMMPENSLVYYECDQKLPKHFAVAVNKFKYRTDRYFKKYFGGVTAFTKEQYTSINGFSNLFFGWGCEDDDLYNRALFKFEKIIKLDAKIARYYAVEHVQDKPNPMRYFVLGKLKKHMKENGITEGLNTLNYSVTSIEKHLLFTRILVNYDQDEIKNSAPIDMNYKIRSLNKNK